MYNGPKPKFTAETLVPSATRPTNPKEGMIYTDDGTSRQVGLWQYLGGIWSTVAGAAASLFTSVSAGIVPASGGGTNNYLRADGTWTTPPTSNITIDNYATVEYREPAAQSTALTAQSFYQVYGMFTNITTTGSWITSSAFGFTLDEGTYAVDFLVPFYGVNQCRVRLGNIAGSVGYLQGSTGFINGPATVCCFIRGTLVVPPGGRAFTVHYRIQSANSTAAGNNPISWDGETAVMGSGTILKLS